MRQPSLSKRVFRQFYPNVVPGDPQDLQDFGNTFLVPELEGAINRFYGSAYVDRRGRRPGIDYNDRAWRQRLCQAPFQYHRELFRILDQLRLSPHDINAICDWWGTKTEVDAWEKTHPGRVIAEDDIWDNIPLIRMVGTPMAFCHDVPSTAFTAAAETQPPPQRRRSSRLRRLFFSRPHGVTSWRDLHPSGPRPSSGSRTSSSGLGSLSSHEETTTTRPSNPPTDDETVLEDSVGINLNRHLHAGIRNSEFEDWLKEEAEMGRLPSSNVNHTQRHDNPFAITTGTISYSNSHQAVSGHSYSRRVNDYPPPSMTSAPMYQGDLHTLPVTVTGPSESALRSSPAPRQSSLVRYRTTPYHYRPIRPRPARNSS